VLNNDLPGAELISVVVVVTIILSAFAHGMTARPLASALAKRLQSQE
jgi:NhaP-type Na+/H+ or K+/H+ antiporter